MKKLLSVVTLLGALSGAASALPYTLPAPAGGALTPYDWQPVYAVEGLYSVADQSKDPDLMGVRGSFNLYSNAESAIRHQFSINIGYLTGDTTNSEFDWCDKTEATMIPVTLGYDINLGLSENVFLYIGAKAGYAWATIEFSDEIDSVKDNCSGFTYSVGAGLKVQCSSTVYLKAGYEFGRTYLDDFHVPGIEKDGVIYGAHTISVGVGCTF